MGGFAEEVGVVGRNQIDQRIDLILPLGRLEQRTIFFVVGHPQRLHPLPQPAGDQRLPVGAEPDPAALVDEVRQKVVGGG